MKKPILIMAFFLCYICVCFPGAQAATINAASCERADVQSAINSASDGDIVTMPAGTCIWTTGINVAKSLKIQGAGIDQTTIQDNTDSSTQLFYLQGTGKSIRLEGMTIKDISGSTADYTGSISVRGTDNTIVLYYIKFSGQRWRALTWSGTRVYGVLSHCIFNDVTGINVQPDNWDEEWTTPMSYGTAKAVFIEDSTFTYSSWNGGIAPIDSKHGSRIVFRHNTVTNSWIGNHGCDSVIRSAMQAEVYGNTFNGDGWTTIQFRGGSALVFDNTINGYHSGGALQVQNYRSSSLCAGLCGAGVNPPGSSYQCMGGGYPWCDGTESIDGNTGLHGYPCRDQIGRGANQALYPMYQWNNSGCSWTVITNFGGGTDYTWEHIEANRDYYDAASLVDAKSKGLSSSYTPYTYPHPLAGGAPSQTCSQLGGTPCSFGQACQGGSFEFSSDYGSMCCVGGSCQTPVQTCSSQGYYCCPSGYTCSQPQSGTGCTGQCCASQSVCTQPSATTITVDSTYSGYSTSPIHDGIINASGGKSTTWASAESLTDPHWITISFPAATTINYANLWWAYNFVQQRLMTSQQVQVQYWDGSAYTTAVTLSYSGDVTNSSTIFPAVNTTSIRFYQPAGMGNPSYPVVLWITEAEYGYTEACSKADSNCDSCVSDTELFAFIDLWNVNSSNPTLKELIEAIGLWKRGGCS